MGCVTRWHSYKKWVPKKNELLSANIIPPCSESIIYYLAELLLLDLTKSAPLLVSINPLSQPFRKVQKSKPNQPILFFFGPTFRLPPLFEYLLRRLRQKPHPPSDHGDSAASPSTNHAYHRRVRLLGPPPARRVSPGPITMNLSRSETPVPENHSTV